MQACGQKTAYAGVRRVRLQIYREASMLELKNISKEYRTGAEVVHALRGVDLAFRESEFVSVLGPSGCGKTTMLNILGGLDQYTSGDLVIDGISTKEYRDADWDAYRNDTIGFVFQSYNLISHQTVLSNVELALTLSGVSKEERRRRAVAALEQVGLGDQINKRPAEMSGGQVQRVAIARALINDPDIILADEPTGALDSETSTQVMDILKSISSRKLVIMVTHNPELAETYSTRIVRLSDGRVISDTDPYLPGAETAAAYQSAGAETAAAYQFAGADTDTAYQLAESDEAAYLREGRVAMNREGSGKRRARRRRNKSMSMATALQLSRNNLMTKKARTFLTSFAGSIGIIGIALILSVSNGFQTYIDKLEEDTLSSYPLIIQSETADMTSMITAFVANAQDTKGEESGDSIHEQQIMTDMLASIGSNDLAAFKKRIDSSIDTIGEWFNDYEYSYGISPLIYSLNMDYGVLRVSPGSIMQTYMNNMQTAYVSYANTDVFFQMMDNQELLKTQYKVLAGRWPQKYDELLLVLDSEDQMNDYVVYTLGLRDPQELKDMINEVMKGNEVENTNSQLEWTYDDFIGMEFSLVNPCDTFRRNSSYSVWEDMTDDDDYMKDLIEKGERLRITGIVCAKDKSGAAAMSTGVGYLPSLTMHMIDVAGESDIVRIQKADKNTDVFSGKSFEDIRNNTDEGLGFEDMISIDQNKLKKALGGDIDPNAVQKDIEKIAKKEINDLSENDSAEKVAADVNESLSAGCAKMLTKLREQADKDPESFAIDDDTVSKALKESLDGSAHAQIVNPLLKGYAEVLKASGPSIQAATTLPAQVAAFFASQETEITAEDAAELLQKVPEGDAALAAAIAEKTGVSDPKALMILTQGVKTISESDPLDTLFTALGDTIEAYTSAEKLQSGIEQYAKGIEMMQDAKVVGPALGKAAEAVGKQFNIDPSGIADAFTMKMSEDEITRLITAYISGDDETSYESNLRKLGYADLENPASIYFYLKDFESKENFLQFIDDYNKEMQDAGNEDLVISFTDLTGTMIKSVKTITNAVSYVLIAFVAISLIVSSIMIGVITYISVLERTKEIGILRAIGASKKDISRIFNAETIIVGFCAGVIGIAASLLLLIPINKVLIGLTKIAALKAILPAAGGIALVIISIFLTFIAGLIPSGMAARKDPVVALRTE